MIHCYRCRKQITQGVGLEGSHPTCMRCYREMSRGTLPTISLDAMLPMPATTQENAR